MSYENNEPQNGSRRMFLKFSTKLLLATSTIYVVGSAFKNLDGSLVAGAKSCEYDRGFGSGACDNYIQDGFPTMATCNSDRNYWLVTGCPGGGNSGPCCFGFTSDCNCVP